MIQRKRFIEVKQTVGQTRGNTRARLIKVWRNVIVKILFLMKDVVVSLYEFISRNKANVFKGI